MTLKEIAEQADVSISTVSRVLNHPEINVASKAVRERIWQIVNASGYIPNGAARALKSGSSQTDSAQSPKYLYSLIATSPDERLDDTFYTRLVDGIEREIFRHNFFLDFTFYASDMNIKDIKQHLDERSAEGLIILGRFQPPLYNQMRQYFKNIVYAGLNTIDVPCDQVICDGYQASYDMVHYFHSLGHREIAFIGPASDVRQLGYLNAMKHLHLTINRKHISGSILPSLSNGYEAMSDLLKKSPDFTALCCADDTLAIGALRASKDFGKQVPDDISIMGIIDLETAQYVSPMLSSYQVPLEEMGSMTAKLLLDRINGGHRLPMKCYLPYTMVRRESCKKRR